MVKFSKDLTSITGRTLARDIAVLTLSDASIVTDFFEKKCIIPGH